VVTLLRPAGGSVPAREVMARDEGAGGEAPDAESGGGIRQFNMTDPVPTGTVRGTAGAMSKKQRRPLGDRESTASRGPIATARRWRSGAAYLKGHLKWLPFLNTY
jgi:hypothetical protein